MAERCPGARIVGPARLPRHRIFFTRDSAGFSGGVASIARDDAAEVWGVLWDITESDRAALDSYEGFPFAYKREQVTIEARGSQQEAMAYVAIPTAGRAPEPEYLEGIIGG